MSHEIIAISPNLTIERYDDGLDNHSENMSSPTILGQEWLLNENEGEPDTLDLESALVTSPALLEPDRGFIHIETENGNLIVNGSEDGSHRIEWHPNNGDTDGPALVTNLEALFSNKDAPGEITMGEQWAGFSEFGKVVRAGEYYINPDFVEPAENESPIREYIVDPNDTETDEADTVVDFNTLEQLNDTELVQARDRVAVSIMEAIRQYDVDKINHSSTDLATVQREFEKRFHDIGHERGITDEGIMYGTEPDPGVVQKIVQGLKDVDGAAEITFGARNQLSKVDISQMTDESKLEHAETQQLLRIVGNELQNLGAGAESKVNPYSAMTNENLQKLVGQFKQGISEFEGKGKDSEDFRNKLRMVGEVIKRRESQGETLSQPAVAEAAQPASPEIVEYEKHHEGMTRNDRQLAEYLLGMGGNEYDSLYGLLTGMKSTEKRQPWDEAKRNEAESGMRELFETALGVKIKDDGLEGARSALARLRTEQSMQDTLKRLNSYGRKLKYQNMPEKRFEDGFKAEGDFLHFGVNANYDSAPDKLEYPTRIYVTPRLEATGHVAAEVIKRARAQGYEPYGKVWDDVSREGDVNDRLDRILFWPKTESQTKIIMSALAEIQTENPELFEDGGPLGTSETILRGVGLAEEPVQTNEDFKQSFNQVREDLISEAWEKAQISLLGGQAINLSGSSLSASLRKAVENGDVEIGAVVNTLGLALKKIAPKYHVSPEDFALNMR